MRKLINKAPCKSSAVDPVPTWLLKQSLDELIPIIAGIMNASLDCGTVPPDIKLAHVKPLLKKPGLYSEILQNCRLRPVSNIPFLSKILQKSCCITDWSSRGHQRFALKLPSSRYRDILQLLIQGSITVLILLDLSAAFDTIDHDILVRRLETMFGITASVTLDQVVSP